MSRLVRIPLVALTAGALLAPGLAVSAAADSDELWWVEASGLRAAQEVARGEGVTVAVLDFPMDPSAPGLEDADIQPGLDTCPNGDPRTLVSNSAKAEHGTMIASYILGNGEPVDGNPGVPGIAPDATIINYGGWVGDCDDTEGEYVAEAIADAHERGADIFITASSLALSPDRPGGVAMLDAMRDGMIVVAAVANDPNEYDTGRTDGIEQFNGVVAVENADSEGGRDTPVEEDFVAIVAPGDDMLVYLWNHDETDGAMDLPTLQLHSNSLAAAFTAGTLALAKSAHPDATGNQILQSMVRNTGGQEHEPERTPEAGFGFLNLERLVSVDPTGYPDENPLLRDDALPAPAAFSAPAGESPGAPGAPVGIPGWLMAVVVVLGLLLLAAIVVIIIVVSRRGRTAAPPHHPTSPTEPRS
ncbi:S8/S53 family peptidase [Homoserinibacter sp. YIM 151385]|uniref:S8/S53 family peptidase n=1 Tax=Homoserinibacter sp. YIM 151385 TaxID=2985506 RepID=UPI0022F0AA54|nr:S8/S53 family peptidase [Homoserinibacter sp. YIM 151385]WBU38698.1 S8/S53 family peptidase [Homoserinibacter sp. YIM 151385]